MRCFIVPMSQVKAAHSDYLTHYFVLLPVYESHFTKTPPAYCFPKYYHMNTIINFC